MRMRRLEAAYQLGIQHMSEFVEFLRTFQYLVRE